MDYTHAILVFIMQAGFKIPSLFNAMNEKMNRMTAETIDMTEHLDTGH
ncbi:hypothetical protein ACE1TI_09805 [Alteribacillus sp. JSM 102045]